MGSATVVHEHWLSTLRQAAEECLREVPRRLLTAQGRSVTNVKGDGDPTIAAEIFVEDTVAAFIAKQSIPAKLHSEERGFLLDAADPGVVVLLDPIDGTFLAVRGLPGACIGISVHSADSMRPIAAVVGDYYTQDLYWGSADGAFRNGVGIGPSAVTKLEGAFVSTCYGKASRIGSMLDQKGLVGTVFWTETTGSMLSMARVGSGQVDACWDLMLGYKPYDLAAGAYVAEAAGAVVTAPDGGPLQYPQDLNQRCRFVIAANKELHGAIMKATTRL